MGQSPNSCGSHIHFPLRVMYDNRHVYVIVILVREWACQWRNGDVGRSMNGWPISLVVHKPPKSLTIFIVSEEDLVKGNLVDCASLRLHIRSAFEP